MVWYSHLLQNFPQFVVIHTVKGIVNKAEVYVFLNLSCLFAFLFLDDSFHHSCESAALNMPANLENSEVATGLEKISFHSNPK